MEQNQTESVPQVSPIRKETVKSAITIDSIEAGTFQKDGTLSAQLRQVITTKSFYPSKKVDNNMQDNLFTTADFGFGEQEFTSVENRVAWMDVPVGTTAETITAMLGKTPNANLYRVVSNKPILTDSQEFAITQGLRTMEEFAESQVTRYPEGTKDDNDVDISGNIVLDKNGKIQYRRVFFSKVGKADIDLRTADKKDVYITPELEAELTGASTLAHQKL